LEDAADFGSHIKLLTLCLLRSLRRRADPLLYIRQNIFNLVADTSKRFDSFSRKPKVTIHGFISHTVDFCVLLIGKQLMLVHQTGAAFAAESSRKDAVVEFGQQLEVLVQTGCLERRRDFHVSHVLGDGLRDVCHAVTCVLFFM